MPWSHFRHHLYHHLHPSSPSISNHNFPHHCPQSKQQQHHLDPNHLNVHHRIYFSVLSLTFLIILSTFFTIVNSMVVIDVTSFNSDTINKPIRPITCSDAKGNQGICMFSLACRQSKGKPIGICKDTIYAGSCCQLPGDEPKPFIINNNQNNNGFNNVNINHNDQNIHSTKLPLETKSTTTMIKVIPSTTIRPTVQTLSQNVSSPPPSTTTSSTTTTATTLPLKTLVLTTTKSTTTTTTTQSPVTTIRSTLNLTMTTTPSNLNITTVTTPSPSTTTTTNPPRTTLMLSSSSLTSTTPKPPLTNTLPPSTVLTPSSSTSFESSSSSSPIPSTEPPPTIPTTTSTEIVTNTEAITTVISSSTSSSFSTETIAETITETQSSPSPSPTPSPSPSSSPPSTVLTESSSHSISLSPTPTPTSTTTTTTTDLPVTVANLLNKVINTQRPYSNKLDCGVSPLKSMARVVGGRNAHFGEWPWQVLIKEATWLGLWMKTKCGGVLIDHRWVLTAAHCQPGFWGSLLVVVGEYDLTGDAENLKPIQKPVKRMIVHRNYNPSTFENDIALMELESPFDVQPHVVPICLPEPGEDFIGQVAHVAGWGKLSYGGPIPSILQVVKLPILANAKCQEMFDAAGHDKEIKSTFLCAGYTDGGKDSCEGDSGGPLMVQRSNGHWVLVGTVSHGIKCAEPNLPGVYMKTAAYRRWIDNIIKRTNYTNNLNQSNGTTTTITTSKKIATNQMKT